MDSVGGTGMGTGIGRDRAGSAISLAAAGNNLGATVDTSRGSMRIMLGSRAMAAVAASASAAGMVKPEGSSGKGPGGASYANLPGDFSAS